LKVIPKDMLFWKTLSCFAHPNPETLLTLLHLHLCETEKA